MLMTNIMPIGLNNGPQASALSKSCGIIRLTA